MICVGLIILLKGERGHRGEAVADGMQGGEGRKANGLAALPPAWLQEE